MKPIKNKYYEENKFPDTWLRYVNKESGDYVDVSIPRGSSGEERSVFNHNPAFYAGYYSIFHEKEKPTYDYCFMWRQNSEQEKDGFMAFKRNEDYIVINFDLNTNKPIMTTELKSTIGKTNIYEIVNLENT